MFSFHQEGLLDGGFSIVISLGSYCLQLSKVVSRFRLISDNLEIALNQVAAHGDIFSRFHLVSSQHPYFDICIILTSTGSQHIADRLRDVILQPIKDGSSSYQEKTLF